MYLGAQKHTNLHNYVQIHGPAASRRSNVQAERLQYKIYTNFCNKGTSPFFIYAIDTNLNTNTDYFSNRHYPFCFRIETNCVLCVVRTEFSYITQRMGRDSSVEIATRYGLDGLGIASRWGARFSASVQTGPGAHPASCTMGAGSFLGVKRPGLGADHPPHLQCRGYERVGLYFYSPSGPGWPLIG